MLLPLLAVVVALVGIGLLVTLWARAKAQSRMAVNEAVAEALAGLPGLPLATDRAELAKEVRSMMWRLPAVLAGFPFAGSALLRAGSHPRSTGGCCGEKSGSC